MDDPDRAAEIAGKAWRNFVEWGRCHPEEGEVVVGLRSGGDAGRDFFKALKAARPDLIESITVEVDWDLEYDDPDYYESLSTEYDTPFTI